MANFRWSENHCPLTWPATRLYQILLLFVFMGQPCKGTSLQAEKLACASITSTLNTQCFIWTTRRIKQNYIPCSSCKTGPYEKLHKNVREYWRSILVFMQQIFTSQCRKNKKKGFSLFHGYEKLFKVEHFNNILKGNEKVRLGFFCSIVQKLPWKS